MSKNWPNLIFLILVLTTAAFFYKRYQIPPAIDLPAISLTDMNGQKVTLDTYAGHPLFLNFFATWCGPCIGELPDLAALNSQLVAQQLKVICISDEPVETLRPLQAQFGDRLVILHSEAKFHDIGVYTYPTNYIFNAKGKKVYQKVNPEMWQNPSIKDMVKQLID